MSSIESLELQEELLANHVFTLTTVTLGVAQEVRMFSVLFILNHVLLNSVTKLSETLHKASNKMLIVSFNHEFHEGIYDYYGMSS